MPGLLDDDLFNDPKKLGLLTMGLSLLSTPGRFGESFGKAGLQGVQATRGAMKDAQQSQLAKLQLDEVKQKALDAQKAREMEMRIAQTAQNFLRPPQPARPGTADLQSMMPPGTSIGAMQPIPEQRGGFDTQGFLSALPSVPGMNPLQAIETQAKYQQLLAKQGPKYSTSPQFTPQGKAYLVGEDGSIKWLDQQVAPRDKVISEDLGGKRIYRTEYSPAQIGEAAKTLSPDTLYSGGITMRGQNMADRRASEANALKRGEITMESGGPSQSNLIFKFGKPQPGYRWTQDGNLEAIPGGPADKKANEQLSGKETVSNVVGSLRQAYDALEKGGGINTTKQGPIGNLRAYASRSAAGQVVGGALGTANQKERDAIAQARPLLLQAIMKATGMSAKQMDSNAELKLYLATATDPTLSLEANREALDRIEALYGGGGWGAPSLNPPKDMPGFSGEVIPKR